MPGSASRDRRSFPQAANQRQSGPPLDHSYQQSTPSQDPPEGAAQQDPYHGGEDPGRIGRTPGADEDLRLYDTSHWMSHNSVWALIEARLRQHTVRPTQLVTQLLKNHGLLQ